jgi:hypothetical protein
MSQAFPNVVVGSISELSKSSRTAFLLCSLSFPIFIFFNFDIHLPTVKAGRALRIIKSFVPSPIVASWPDTIEDSVTVNWRKKRLEWTAVSQLAVESNSVQRRSGFDVVRVVLIAEILIALLMYARLYTNINKQCINKMPISIFSPGTFEH